MTLLEHAYVKQVSPESLSIQIILPFVAVTIFMLPFHILIYWIWFSWLARKRVIREWRISTSVPCHDYITCCWDFDFQQLTFSAEAGALFGWFAFGGWWSKLVFRWFGAGGAGVGFSDGYSWCFVEALADLWNMQKDYWSVNVSSPKYPLLLHKALLTSWYTPELRAMKQGGRWLLRRQVEQNFRWIQPNTRECSLLSLIFASEEDIHCCFHCILIVLSGGAFPGSMGPFTLPKGGNRMDNGLLCLVCQAFWG